MWQGLKQKLRRPAGASTSSPGPAGPGDPLEHQRQRFARRRWQRRWLTWKYLVSVLVALVLVVGGTWLVLFSSHLALKKVTVQGNSYLSDAQVLAAADLPMGEPLARLDLARSSDRVGALVAVQSVDVVRQWPTGVRITVTERQAVAVVQESNGIIRGLDADGVLFRDYAKRPATLPLVTAPDDTDAKALAEAARVASALPGSISRQVLRVEVVSADAITLQLRNGKQVEWGSAEHSERKAEALVPLLKLEGRVYDVSAASMGVVKE